MGNAAFNRNKTLPVDLRPLLWSYNLDEIDLEKDKKTIIINVINYGRLKHWQWLKRTYGTERVREVLSKIRATEIKPRTRRLASIVFNIDQFNYAPRGTH
jgi:hypothetical protein